MLITTKNIKRLCICSLMETYQTSSLSMFELSDQKLVLDDEMLGELHVKIIVVNGFSNGPQYGHTRGRGE